MNKDNKRAIEIAKRVVKTEIDALEQLCEDFGRVFCEIVEAIDNCQGKVIITGMGKSGHVARKIAATMSSLGTSAFFLHPGEAMHGDLGIVQNNDLVIAISYSGESDEIIRIIPNIKIIGAKLIGLTCNSKSTLALNSDLVQCFSNVKEACHLQLAPTTSTTLVMVYGDALSVALAELKGFSKNDFGIFHPAGSLGKRLTIRVIDLMKDLQGTTYVNENSSLADAIVSFSDISSEILPICNLTGKFIGIITNGDVQRAISNNVSIYEATIKEMINYFPVYVDSDTMAFDSLRIMMDHNIHSTPVVKDDRVVGIITRQSILNIGIYV